MGTEYIELPEGVEKYVLSWPSGGGNSSVLVNDMAIVDLMLTLMGMIDTVRKLTEKESSMDIVADLTKAVLVSEGMSNEEISSFLLDRIIPTDAERELIEITQEGL